MIRMFDLVMIFALLAGAAWTFKVKNDSEAALARVADLERRLVAEREAIDILLADWSLLTSPDRLERLTEQFNDDLKIEQMEAKQIVKMDDVPQTPIPLPMPVEADDDFAQTPFLDEQTVTGGVPIE